MDADRKLPVVTERNSDFVDRRRTSHRLLLDWCLTRATACLGDNENEATAKWLLVAGQFADAYGCGQLASGRLEKLALILALRHGPPVASTHAKRTDPRRWLHVLSYAFATGGHTTMLRRWIEADDSGDEHHLALTFAEGLALPELQGAIEQTGGKVTLFGGVQSLLDRAGELRDLAWREADRVVVHSHMWDVIPTIAFGVAGGPPVLLVNHADHTFWVGASIADIVVNLRRSGEELTIRHRGVDRNFLFRIPLPGPGDPSRAAEDRREIRAKLGIPASAIVFLTVGGAVKYNASGGLDFFAMVQRLFSALPEAYLVAVGPSIDDEGWDLAVKTLGPRLIPVGVQRQVMSYHAAADVYLEGFPFDSHTALLEAAVSGLPVVRIPACAMLPFSGHHFPLTAVTQPADVDAYLAQAISLANSRDARHATAGALHDAVVGLQCGTAWRERLGELKKAAPDRHAIYEIYPTDIDIEHDRCWTAFQMRGNRRDPLQFVLRLAKKLKLDAGMDLHPILTEYRRLLGRQSIISSARLKFGAQLGRLLSIRF